MIAPPLSENQTVIDGMMKFNAVQYEHFRDK